MLPEKGRITNAARLDKLGEVEKSGVDHKPEVCFLAIDRQDLKGVFVMKGMKGSMRKSVVKLGL